ncbi:hypothetical protein ACFQ0M_37875 [Kitasatospora aburaviensis]
MAFVLYGGAADSKMYHQKGGELAAYLDQADLLGGIQYDLGMKVAGTGFIIVVTGVVYAITGPSLIGGFLVFSWLGFWGCCCSGGRCRSPSRRRTPASTPSWCSSCPRCCSGRPASARTPG